MSDAPPDKQTLRRDLRAARDAFAASITSDERSTLLAALAAIVAPRLPAEGVVATYSSLGSEIDPGSIVAALPAARVAFPWFADRDAAMAFKLTTGAFDDGPFRIPQPPADALDVEPDVVLVPMIGGDARCHRLGQGKGHYDRFLTVLGQRKRFATIGVAWDVQIVDQLPVDTWDVPLDAIATPTRWIEPPR